MPLWVYKCDVCGETFNVHASRFDLLPTTSMQCGFCDRGTLVRQVSAPSFSVKGYNAANGYSESK